MITLNNDCLMSYAVFQGSMNGAHARGEHDLLTRRLAKTPESLPADWACITRGRFRAGFTLIEVLVVVSVIALLIGILLPSLSRAREQATRTACAAQMHQLIVGLQAYAAENRGDYPLGLNWPATPFGVPPFGAQSYRMRFTEPASVREFTGYPAYIALVKGRQIPDPNALYCPAQEVLHPGGPYTWPASPPNLQEAQALGASAYYDYLIGYAWYVDHWMSKDGYTVNADANFPPFMVWGYPDNWWTHGLGRREGQRQILAEHSEDPLQTILFTDIMQDYRKYSDVLGIDGDINDRWDRMRPQYSLNSHGGPDQFRGGNVAYNDGSVRWRSRTACEADFRASFDANDGMHTWEPQFQHMSIVYSSVELIPGSGTSVYNLYW